MTTIVFELKEDPITEVRVIVFNLAVNFIGGENPKKTTDMPQGTDKLYQIMLY
jgi:hypothetical protein